MNHNATSLSKIILMVFVSSLLFVGCTDYKSAQNTGEKPTLTTDPEIAQTVKQIFDEALVNKESYKLLEQLCKSVGPRLSGSVGAQKAVTWVREVMDESEFDSVYLQECMVPHWERGSRESAFMTLASGENISLTFLAIGGSVPTPQNGLTAEVIEVSSIDAIDDVGEENIRGKIVFYNESFDPRNITQGASYGKTVSQRTQGAIKAAEYGAVGSVIRSLSSIDDDSPHTGTMSYNVEVDSIPHGALGVQSAIKLSEALKQGKVTLTMDITSQWFEDAISYNVIGEIRGSEFPGKIITVGGHLDSWDVAEGAHDDGAGCMHALGALKLFKKLGISPRHTIRAVMFMNEENGLRGGRKYAAIAKDKNEQHMVAIESDAGGFTPRGFGVTANDEQIEKIQSWLPYFNPNTIAFVNRGGGGADIGPLHETLGTPVIGLNVEGQKTFDYHHSPKDLFESVHPRELELGTASIASLIYLIDFYGL